MTALLKIQDGAGRHLEKSKNRRNRQWFVAKRLDASRCQLVWMYASAQATLC